ncbi:hypothetical protein KWH77_20015, partial [Enterobacter sichuanensis]|uniref:Ig-like domain-containing protein n=1 Tax=Enterobacter sichuanensis TaxID=2071710 RepID=UPI0021D29CDC
PAGNESEPSDPYLVIVDTLAPEAKAIIETMTKDSGEKRDDFVTNDGSSGRVYQGTLTAGLAADEKVQISLDGGMTWIDAIVDGNNWFFQDKNTYESDWSIQTRVIDAAGNSGTIVSKEVKVDTVAPEKPSSVARVEDAIHIELGKAESGDSVEIIIGEFRFSHKITEEDIAKGEITLKIPADIYVNINPDDKVGAAIADSNGNISEYIGKVNADIVENYNRPATNFSRTGYYLDLNGMTLNASDSVNAGMNRISGGNSIDTNYGAMDSSQTVSGGKLIFTMKQPTQEVHFALSVKSRSTTVTFFDDEGNIIGTQTINASSGSTTNGSIDFVAPAGVDIARFEVNQAKSTASGGYNVKGIRLVTSSEGEIHQGEEVIVHDGNYYADSEGTVFVIEKDETLDNDINIIGKEGVDVLKFIGKDQFIDLSENINKLHSVEVLDITGNGDNTLQLNLNDVLSLGHEDLFHENGYVQVMVKGDNGDQLNLSDLIADMDVGDWIRQSELINIEGQQYVSYQHDGLMAEVLVQENVQTNII